MGAKIFSRKVRVVHAVQYTGTPDSWAEVLKHVDGHAVPLSNVEFQAAYQALVSGTSRITSAGPGKPHYALRVRSTIKMVCNGVWVYCAEGTVYVQRDDYIHTHFDEVVGFEKCEGA